MIRESQKRAAAKYQKEKVRQVTVKFSPSDYELYEYLEEKGSRAGYIKGLIRADMERNR